MSSSSRSEAKDNDVSALLDDCDIPLDMLDDLDDVLDIDNISAIPHNDDTDLGNDEYYRPFDSLVFPAENKICCPRCHKDFTNDDTGKDTLRKHFENPKRCPNYVNDGTSLSIRKGHVGIREKRSRAVISSQDSLAGSSSSARSSAVANGDSMMRSRRRLNESHVSDNGDSNSTESHSRSVLSDITTLSEDDGVIFNQFMTSAIFCMQSSNPNVRLAMINFTKELLSSLEQPTNIVSRRTNDVSVQQGGLVASVAALSSSMPTAESRVAVTATASLYGVIGAFLLLYSSLVVVAYKIGQIIQQSKTVLGACFRNYYVARIFRMAMCQLALFIVFLLGLGVPEFIIHFVEHKAVGISVMFTVNAIYLQMVELRNDPFWMYFGLALIVAMQIFAIVVPAEYMEAPIRDALPPPASLSQSIESILPTLSSSEAQNLQTWIALAQKIQRSGKRDCLEHVLSVLST